MKTTITIGVIAVLVAGCASPTARRSSGYREPGVPYSRSELVNSGLPPSAAERILAGWSWSRDIIDVRKVLFDNRYKTDLLGVSLSIGRPVYHTTLILSKSASQPDWSNATVSHLTSKEIGSIADLFALSWENMQPHLRNVEIIKKEMKWRLQQDESTVSSEGAPSEEP